MTTFTPADVEELCRALRSLGDDLAVHHVDDETAASFPAAKWKLLGELGVMSLPFDPRWGGLGLDLPATLRVLEVLGQVCPDAGLNFSVTSSMCGAGVALSAFGSDHLKDRYLADLGAGRLVGAHAITEPDSGSDALALTTRVERDGDRVVLTGSKTFVSNGPLADVVIVYARSHPRGGPLGTTAVAIERDTPGLTFGRPLAKMGLKTSPMCEVFLDGCVVDRRQVIGRWGGGYLLLDHVMKWEILLSFIVNVGEMQRRLATVTDYARTRRQFGQRIGSYQAVARRIVDMMIRVETGRMWLHRAAEKVERGEEATIDLAVAKLVVSEGNVASGLDAVQVLGGNGYMVEYGVEKELRAAVAGTIYSGTTEIQYNRIASRMGL